MPPGSLFKDAYSEAPREINGTPALIVIVPAQIEYFGHYKYLDATTMHAIAG